MLLKKEGIIIIMKKLMLYLLCLSLFLNTTQVFAFNTPSNQKIVPTQSKQAEYRIDLDSVAWNGSIIIFDLYVGYLNDKQKFGSVPAYSSLQKFRVDCKNKRFVIDTWSFFDTSATLIHHGVAKNGWRPFTETSITNAITSTACGIGS